MSTFKVWTDLEVRFRDCDPMNHVNNAVYATYLEVGRQAYWSRFFSVLDYSKVGFILARLEIDYRSPARVGETLRVFLRVPWIGRSSFGLEYEIRDRENDRLVVEATSVQTSYDYEKSAVIQVPEDLRQALEKVEGHALAPRPRDDRRPGSAENLAPTAGVLCTGPDLGRSALCEPILRSLPEWFGIETANQHYLEAIEALPTFLASVDGVTAGFLSLKQHNAAAAEIYVMGVRPEFHRRGVGRALLHRAQETLRGRGSEYLQVKTLSASHLDPGYARTRAFYEAMGFRPLEEFPTLWGEANPCLLMVKRL